MHMLKLVLESRAEGEDKGERLSAHIACGRIKVPNDKGLGHPYTYARLNIPPTTSHAQILKRCNQDGNLPG